MPTNFLALSLYAAPHKTLLVKFDPGSEVESDAYDKLEIVGCQARKVTSPPGSNLANQAIDEIF